MQRLIYGLIAFGLSVPAHAVGAALSLGRGDSYIHAYRMAVLWDLGAVYPVRHPYPYHAETFWEISGAYWDGKPGVFEESQQNASIFTTGPQIRWQRSDPNHYGQQPYIELGIGFSWISQKEIGGRRLSMHFQFEDRLGFGVRLGPTQLWDVSFRLIHYSNASFGRNNSGVNTALVTVGRWF